MLGLHNDWVFSGDWWEELFIHHVWKLWELYFDEIEDFLRNEVIDNETRAFLALKIAPNTGISDSIRIFLSDDSVDAYVKVKLSQRIISWSLTPEILKYLRDESKDWWSRWAIAMTLRWHTCSDILHILKNEHIDENVRSALIDTVPMNSTQYSKEVLLFLANPNIDVSVREMLALTLEENDSFRRVVEFLRNKNIPVSIRKAITAYCKFELCNNIFTFLKDETINFEVRMSVITSLESVDITQEILDFLKRENIDYAVRFEFGFKIKKWKLTPDLRQFIENPNYDMNIRRNLLESLLSTKDIDIRTLFKNLWVWEKKQNESQRVNRWQTGEITGKTDIFEEHTRTLNFYYRQAQWSFDPHFEIISDFIKYYIENWYSRVWNKYRIIGRHPSTKKLWESDVTYREMMAFRSISTIYADTIHLTHWSPESQIPWSQFILWNTITQNRDNEESEWDFWFDYKMDSINESQYTILDLDYFWWNVGYFFRWEWWNNLWIPNLSIEKICKRVLDSLHAAESKIIGQSKTVPQRVQELLTV